MSVKNQSKADSRKVGAAPAPRSEADGEDIARLLRALNDDLKADPADDYDPDVPDDEAEAKAERRLPVGMIAVALLAAVGIGFGVVMFDQEQATVPQTSPETADAGAPATGPQPLIARPDLGPQAAGAPRPGATGAVPTPVLTPVPMPTPAPAPAANAPVAALPAPAAAPTAPAATAPIRIPEPPRLPEPAAARTAHQAPKPVAAPAPTPAPPSTPVASAAPAAPPAGMVEPAPVAPNAVVPARPVETPAAEAPVPAPTAPTTVATAAPAAGGETGGEADAGALQAMLAPPEPVKPEPAPPAARPAAPARSGPGQAAGVRGRYAIQLGSFQLAENADALVRRLQAGGLDAYAVNWTDSAERTWRVVRVGHYAGSDEALQAVGGLRGIIGGLTPIVVGTR